MMNHHTTSFAGQRAFGYIGPAMSIRSFFVFVAVAAFCCSAGAEQSRLGAEHIFKPLLGKRVSVEGLAWGAGAKGLGERIVLPSGISIYFTGSRYSKLHRNGKLVRVVGRLSVERMAPAPPGAQGYPEPFDYYALEVESVDVIDEVRHEFPQLIK